ncbi:hypothetical protein [Taibaiella koreensis]|uniref:hypothetical protein n=1 Tax=Taibaiella koreensis TaxID=1268548 RepID=UPI000E59DB08|nr:hypothetical protein [Taibaiella koreensis]
MTIKTLFTACLLSPLWAVAQDQTETLPKDNAPNQPNQFSIAVNGGLTFPFTDVKKKSKQPVFGIGAQYAAMPWLGINLDVQMGKLKAGDRNDASVYNMEFSNSFFYGAVTARFYPLRLALTGKSDADVQTNIKYLGGLYAGVGAGFIVNKVEARSTSDPNVGLIPDPDGAGIVVPAEVGYYLPIAHLNKAYTGKVYGRSQLSLNINYRHNLSFSEKLDGYNPTGYSNKSKDAFSTLTVGLSYNL